MAGTLNLARMDRPGLRERLAARILLVITASNIRLTNDVDLLLATMSGYATAQSAIVLMAGTRSVVMRYAIKPGSSEPVRVTWSGGQGHVLCDEGRGYAIGREAIMHALRAVEDKRLGLRPESPGCLNRRPSGNSVCLRQKTPIR
jgi:N-acetylmuramic acid 6-phosphate etherase